MNVDLSLKENIKQIKKLLPVDNSFDIVGRDIDIGGTGGYILFVDGFAKDEAMIHVMKGLQGVSGDVSESALELMLKDIPYIETEVQTDLVKAIDAVLSGQVALFVDGENRAVLIDARQYPSREPSESHIEKVTRGSRDDLVETLVFNTALVRRRLRDRGLTFEITNVGDMSKTDVAIGYIESQVDKQLLKKVRRRINDIDIHALTLGERSLEELLVKRRWYNPMPQFRVSERPDTIAAHLAEGHIVILVDTSPTAIIIPSTFLYFTQYVEDYYKAPIVGNVTRFIRILAILVAIFLLPLFMLMVNYPDQTPQLFRVLIPTDESETNVFVQVIILELGLELLQLSSLHIPTNTESAFSIIGGLILSDFAVSMGLLLPDSIFYTVGATIATNCIPNPELGDATKIFRWFMTICTGFFGIWGFGASVIIVLLIVGSTKTVDEKHKYFWPLIPFDGGALKHMLFRYPLMKMESKQGNKK